jgi:putative oxidoreductase
MKYDFSKQAAMTPLIIRIVLGSVLFAHGAQKLLGWFNGYGFSGTMNYFTETEGLPWIVGFGVILIEFFGPIALLLGVATRFTSLAIIVVMAGVIITNFHTYFFMNWFGSQKEEGYEFFILMIGMSLSLVASGAGKYSVVNLFKNIRQSRNGLENKKVPQYS